MGTRVEKSRSGSVSNQEIYPRSFPLPKEIVELEKEKKKIQDIAGHILHANFVIAKV
jgi:hypothetical protein